MTEEEKLKQTAEVARSLIQFGEWECEAPPSIDSLKEAMQKGVVHFIFKKADGSLREAFGTLSENLLPILGEIRKEKGKDKPETVFTYFDLEANNFRTFTKASLISVVRKISKK